MFYYCQSYCMPFILSQSITDAHINAYLYYLIILTVEPHSLFFFLLSFMYKMLGKAVCVFCFSAPTQLCKNGSWVSLQCLFTDSFRDHTACCQLITLYGNIFSVCGSLIAILSLLEVHASYGNWLTSLLLSVVYGEWTGSFHCSTRGLSRKIAL